MTQTPERATTSGSYFVRHWRGELSLPKSYWINGVIIGLVCRAIFTGLLTGIAAVAASMHLLALLFVLATLVNIAILIWIVVGIWRSAGRYVGPKFWAILARVAVVIGIIDNVFIEINNFSNLASRMSSGN